MADGDYERGRGREIDAIAAELKRLAAARSASAPYQREGRAPARPQIFVLNGWAASPHAWTADGLQDVGVAHEVQSAVHLGLLELARGAARGTPVGHGGGHHEGGGFCGRAAARPSRTGTTGVSPIALIRIGFAAETGAPAAEAARKCREKGLDLVVGNDVSEPGSGFGTRTNRVTFVTPDGRVQHLPLMSKLAVARRIVRFVEGVGG